MAFDTKEKVPAQVDPEILAGVQPENNDDHEHGDCGCGCSGEGFGCKVKKFLKKAKWPLIVIGVAVVGYFAWKYFKPKSA